MIVNDYEIKLVMKTPKSKPLGLMVDLMLTLSSLTLLIINILEISTGVIQVILSLLCTSLLSGYALLNIFGFRKYFSSLEMLVLSYVTSYILTAFLTLGLILMPKNTRTQLILGTYIVFGIASILKHLKTKIPLETRSFTRNIDALAITLVIAFYTLSFYFLYPSFAVLPGSDISRHYEYSLTLIRAPDLYTGSAYLFAHLHESAFISLSNQSVTTTQTALLTLNLVLPLAFYVMAKEHLQKIDARLPSLATLFWVLFTNSFGGFAWIYFIFLKLLSTGQSQLQLLSSTADKTYNGTIYGIFGLWYVPVTISFALLMTTIFLIGKMEVPKAKYIGLLSFLIAGLYLTHVAEAVFFALFLAIYKFLSKNEDYRTDDAVISTIIGFIIVIMIYYALSLLILRFIMNTSILISIIGPIAALLFSLTFKRYIYSKLPLTKVIKTERRFLAKIFVFSLFFVYTLALFLWVSLIDLFNTWQFDTIGLVPWFIYPLMLGINGILAIIALYHINNKSLYRRLAFFILFMAFAFVVGRIVSVINLHFFSTGYWEKRFIWFIKIPLAVLAPLSIIYATDKIRKSGIRIDIKKITSLILIGTIVLFGISTTFLNLEYWNKVANNPANHPSHTEMCAINAFKEMLDNDPRTWLATVTSGSSAIATFAAPADKLGLKQLLYTAYRPEMTFMQLYRHPAYDHPYVYIHSRDLSELKKFADSFFAKHLSMLPIVFENPEVKIYNASKPSPPQPNSDTALILPLDKGLCSEESFYIAYDMLSEGFYNYTVAYDLDEKILDAKTIILAYDPPSEGLLATSYQDSFNQTLGSWSIIKGNWKITNGELFGGEVGKYGEGIILSQVSAQNFRVSFKTKPLSGNATALNYVRLLYSWVNSENYRMADIMFGTDGYVYVHIRTITNGVEQIMPNWPGIKTDLKWDFSNEYNITVTVNGTLNQISVNDKPYLSLELENILGRIGLGYYRFYQAVFDDFTINYNIKLNLRTIEDYIRFLELGGKIIILNTNGYNFFTNNLLTLTNNTFNAEKIEELNGKLELPIKIPMQKLLLKDSTASVISNYIGSNGENPFIIKQNYGKGELFYVNIYPILESIRKAEDPSAFYPVLGRLLGDLKLPKLDNTFILVADGYVKAVDISGNSKAETRSLIFPLEIKFKQLEILTKNGSFTLYNVTSIQIKCNSNIIVEAENFALENGQGFYAALRLNSTFAVKPSIGMLNVLVAKENEEIQITNVEKLSITPHSSVNLLARTPEISASQATFTEFYPLGSLQWSTNTYGQNLKVTGPTTFQIMLSDSYTILKNVKLGQFFTRDPPSIMFDELSTIPIAIFWVLLLLPILLGIVLIHASKHLQQPQSNLGEKL
ncbi:MAG: hypothetical protein QXQ64_01360 [Candidatus Bathyarchaeia archaeon]